MAVVKRNIIVEGLSGSLGGQLVFQKGRDGRTIVRTMPTPSQRAPSERQLTTRSRFKKASAYASQAKDGHPLKAGQHSMLIKYIF